MNLETGDYPARDATITYGSESLAHSLQNIVRPATALFLVGETFLLLVKLCSESVVGSLVLTLLIRDLCCCGCFFSAADASSAAQMLLLITSLAALRSQLLHGQAH